MSHDFVNRNNQGGVTGGEETNKKSAKTTFKAKDDALIAQVTQTADKVVRPSASEDTNRQNREQLSYKNPYFNQDVQSVRGVNQRTQAMKALRGNPDAVDLRKITLPLAAETPPVVEAGMLETLYKQFQHADAQSLLHDVLSALAARITGSQMTQAELGRRQAQLEVMIKARLAALLRMKKLGQTREHRWPMLAQAIQTGGNVAAEQQGDPTELLKTQVQSITLQATRMQQIIAKVLKSRKNL